MYFTSLIYFTILMKSLPVEGQTDTLTSPSPVLECPRHQTPSNCSTIPLCQGRCFGPRFLPCPLIRCYNYSVECVCKEGYIRVDVDGRCILKCDCAKLCKRNEEYTECGSACPETCDGIIPDECVDGTPGCVGTCQCKKGYIRKTAGGPCISRNHCNILQ